MGNTISRRGNNVLIHSYQITQLQAFCSKVQNPSKYGQTLRNNPIRRGRRGESLPSKDPGLSAINSMNAGRTADHVREYKKTLAGPGHGQGGDLRGEKGVSISSVSYGHLDSREIDNSTISATYEHQNKDQQDHHIFDEEYFGSITQTLTDSSEGKNAEENVEVKHLNLFDEQYFEAVTKELTEYGASQVNEPPPKPDHHPGEAFPYGEHNGPSNERTDSDLNQENVFDEEYFGAITKQLTDQSKGIDYDVGLSNGAPRDMKENVFDEEYFGAITKQLTDQIKGIDYDIGLSNGAPQDMENLDPHSRTIQEETSLPEESAGVSANYSDEQYSRNGTISDESTSSDLQIGISSPRISTVIEGNREAGKRKPRNARKVIVQHTVDTALSEADVFWTSFMERERMRRKIDINERPSLLEESQEGNFSPAEHAQKLDTSTGNTGVDYTMSSLLSQGLSLSETDRLKLGASREIQEQARDREDIRNRSLEPEVERVLKEFEKKRAVPKPKTSQEIELFGTPDTTIPISEHSCTGCGALLHCQEVTLPGYLPSERFKALAESKELDDAICLRCWHFIRRKQALNVNLDAVDHKRVISDIKKKRANVLVMVDLMDFPCSVIPGLKTMVGETTPMVIIGNKFDLLPQDSQDYQQRVGGILLETCIRENVCDEDQVTKVQLISAKTGFGVEDLITLLQRIWGSEKDVYLLGTANIGKSTLFKTLLNSDYSKAKASYLIRDPTISPWPGTTLNLLKFPILRPTGDKLATRRARLKAEAARDAEERKKNRKYDTSNIRLSAYVEGKVGRSYPIELKGEVLDEDTEEVSVGSFEDPFNTMHPDIRHNPMVSRPKKKDLIAFKHIEFDSGKWLYDTPGVLHDRQVLTHLTMAELRETMANRVLVPRTLIMKPGFVMFLGGLGRLDYVQGERSVYFTVFAAKTLPVRYCAVEEADDYYETHAGQRYFKVPIGGKERMKTFPKLSPTDIRVEGCGWQESAMDIVLSSAGWVAVTAGTGMEISLKAFTPNGDGCFSRRPALLPFAVNMKGPRTGKKSPFYAADPEAVLRFR